MEHFQAGLHAVERLEFYEGEAFALFGLRICAVAEGEGHKFLEMGLEEGVSSVVGQVADEADEFVVLLCRLLRL